MVTFQYIPLFNKWWHKQFNVFWFVHVVTNAVRQCADCIIQDKQVFVLIFVKSKDERFQNEAYLNDEILNHTKLHNLGP